MLVVLGVSVPLLDPVPEGLGVIEEEAETVEEGEALSEEVPLFVRVAETLDVGVCVFVPDPVALLV